MKSIFNSLVVASTLAVFTGCSSGPAGLLGSGPCAGGSCGSGGCVDGSCGAGAGSGTGSQQGGPLGAMLGKHHVGSQSHMGDQPGPAFGPSAPTVTYPYYTTRGPRDFLNPNPPSIGR
ncbi:MAG: hypothetical protein KDA87_09845 [Planctomycetales bacterium]|nr:hypothetical protein [Planctomycetales bacterium]